MYMHVMQTAVMNNIHHFIQKVIAAKKKKVIKTSPKMDANSKLNKRNIIEFCIEIVVI